MLLKFLLPLQSNIKKKKKKLIFTKTEMENLSPILAFITVLAEKVRNI